MLHSPDLSGLFMKNKKNARLQLVTFSAAESRISNLDSYRTSDLSCIPNLHDLFKSITFLNRTSVWQAFQGTKMIALSWDYSMLGCHFFAKEVATASGKTVRRNGLSHTLLISFAVQF